MVPRILLVWHIFCQKHFGHQNRLKIHIRECDYFRFYSIIYISLRQYSIVWNCSLLFEVNWSKNFISSLHYFKAFFTLIKKQFELKSIKRSNGPLKRCLLHKNEVLYMFKVWIKSSLSLQLSYSSQKINFF